jgi:hypothetical protein
VIDMTKRSITGWRQMPPAESSLRKRSRARPAAIAQPVAEPPPKAQWETEGGTVATPVKKINTEKG